MSTRWRLTDDALTHVREWDGEFVVYHAPSGDTHLLNEPGMRVLNSLCAQPATEEELLNSFSDVVDSRELAADIDELLQQLARLGLIRS